MDEYIPAAGSRVSTSHSAPFATVTQYRASSDRTTLQGFHPVSAERPGGPRWECFGMFSRFFPQGQLPLRTEKLTLGDRSRSYPVVVARLVPLWKPSVFQ